MSESPEVRIVLDKTWTRSDLPTDMNVESRGDQFIATVKEEDVVIVVNQFLSKRELGSMVFSHIPPYKPPVGTKICNKCNGSGTVPSEGQ